MSDITLLDQQEPRHSDSPRNADSVDCPVTREECTLSCLTSGQKGRVSMVEGPNRCRLMELGFTRGTEVEVSRQAAFGGPLLIQLRSYRLSLRRDEAEAIRVEPARTTPAPGPKPKPF